MNINKIQGDLQESANRLGIELHTNATPNESIKKFIKKHIMVLFSWIKRVYILDPYESAKKVDDELERLLNENGKYITLASAPNPDTGRGKVVYVVVWKKKAPAWVFEDDLSIDFIKLLAGADSLAVDCDSRKEEWSEKK